MTFTDIQHPTPIRFARCAMKERDILVALGIAAGLILVTGTLILVLGFRPIGAGGPAGPGPGQMMRGPFQPSEFSSNGQRIYYTATSRSGEPIAFTGGPPWLYMHGGSCVDCHGPDGRGGYLVPMTSQMAPDIRYSTLTSERHEEGEEMEHPPYTKALTRRAITRGLDPAGQPLDPAMPRWRMSEGDIDDLVDYLKTLDGRASSDK
ncbi:MAG: cytochrome c [Armatimonadetes bacterium]|nr:cytochrome c [Armatimonadota bacterium]